MAKKQTKKNKKTNKIKRNVAEVFLLSLIIFFALFCVYRIIKLAIRPTGSFLIEEGTISKSESLTGYVIRDEKVIKNDENTGKIVQIKNEGEKVAVGESVFRYEASNEQELNNKIKKLNEEIQKAMDGQVEVLPSDIKAIDKQIESKISEIQNINNIQNIKEYKNDIDGYITKKAKISGELSPAGSYIRTLIEERTEIANSLYDNSKYEKASISGIVSYRVDGLEGILTTENFDSITPSYLKELNLTTGQIISTNENEGKIINNFKCYIAVITNSDEAKNAEIGDKVNLKLSDSSVIDGEIAYINKTDKDLVIILKISKEVEKLANYRKISLDIIWWEKNGLRVPNSSLIFEDGLSYVIRTKAGVLNKILVKISKESDDFSIITNYTTEELKNMNYTGEQINSMKKIGIYDEIIVDPDIEEINKKLQ